MISVKSNEGQVYEAAKHSGVFGLMKLTESDTQRISVNYSVFLPNGGAELSASPKERVYYVVSGKMKLTGDGNDHVLDTGDLIYIAPGEQREVELLGNKAVESLVFIVTP
jgi:quercetin dioxygenase-like cupin family protein